MVARRGAPAALPQLPSCTAASTHATPPAEIPARDTNRLHVRVVQVALPAVLDRDIARLRDEVDPYTLTLHPKPNPNPNLATSNPNPTPNQGFLFIEFLGWCAKRAHSWQVRLGVSYPYPYPLLQP